MLQPALPVKRPTTEIYDDGLRILVLDDSDFDLRRVSRLLFQIRPDVHLETTKTIEEFETAFRASLYDLCLIDHSLSGGKTGSDAIEIIKSSVIASQTPAVLVTSLSDDTGLIDAMHCGFASYIDKGRMTAATLKTVIAEALDEVSLVDMAQTDRLETVSQVMDDVARLYSSNTKKHLSEIYKTTKFLRECMAQRQWPSPDAIDEIEDRCFSMWRFLDEAENHGLGIKRRPS